MAMNDLNGFRLLASRELREVDAILHEYKHEKSGARLCFLERDDENKTFCISFRTLPFDDSGVFHILEHSVLCGSEKYPVKEPFVELMKGSLNTFLNALTYPDKTCYPVSSRNAQDFLNLMRVYLDAVFAPSIYRKEEIFLQEGWHYAFCEDEPEFQGVVFNEMKGAYSDPDTILYLELKKHLFPDTPYRFSSGGDPAVIPELTYETFLNAHMRFYHPSNSYIYLDGKVDMESATAILDSYLSAYDAIDPQTGILPQKPVCAPLCTAPYVLSAEEDPEEKYRYGAGYLLCDFSDCKRLVAAQVLSDVLCGSNHAPLSKAILDSGLAEDVGLSVSDDQQQPWVMLWLQNFKKEHLEELKKIIETTLTGLVSAGLDREQLEASLSGFEFKLRERDYGSLPRGLAYGLDMLSSWLYDGDPADRLRLGSLFTELRQGVQTGYYETLLNEIFLQNTHMAQVLLEPSHTLEQEMQAQEQARLKTRTGHWSEEEKRHFLAVHENLLASQQQPDSPEALATIPHVTLQDLSPEPEVVPESKLDGTPDTYVYELATDGIVYFRLLFAANDLTAEELPYASLLCSILSNLPTAAHSAEKIQMQLRMYTGGFTATMVGYPRRDAPDFCDLRAVISCSALEACLPQAAALVTEILTQTDYRQPEELLKLIRQMRDELQQSIIGSGSSFALGRVASSVAVSAAADEKMNGISYFRWLRELERSFDERKEALMQNLQKTAQKLFGTARMELTITELNHHAEALRGMLQAGLPEGSGCSRETLALSTVPPVREGIVIPSEVCYCAKGSGLKEGSMTDAGQLRLASKIATIGWLWNAVRVQGGAYGTGALSRDNGLLAAYSYRDPKCDETLRAFDEIADFLKDAAGEELETFIIGTVSDLSPLLSPRMKGAVADANRRKGVTPEYRRELLRQLLQADEADICAAAETFRAAMETAGVCVLGPRSKLEQSEFLQQVEPL